LTTLAPEDYIVPLGALPLSAMARLRSPSLFHTVTEHPAMLFDGHVRVAASDVAGFMFSGPTPDTELRSSGLFDK
jgi:hypothetical protein